MWYSERINIDIDISINNKKGTSSVRENRDGQPNGQTNGRKKPDVEVGAPPKNCQKHVKNCQKHVKNYQKRGFKVPKVCASV